MKKFKVYLAGSIELSKDGGKQWRQKITPDLKKLGLNVLDPVVLEAKKLKNRRPNRLPKYITTIFGKKVQPKMWHSLKDSKEHNFLNRFLSYMQVIIKKDLDYVRNSDFIVVYWNASSFGTAGELTVAFDKKIPIHMVTQVELPAWVRGTCTTVHNSFADLLAFLKEEYGS